jgi:hypothetical protein
MTQIYWLDQAVQASDYKTASERLDALLRQDPNNENRDRFLAVVSSTPEGRAALAIRLKLSPAWSEPYVTLLKDLPAEQLTQRVDVVLRTGRGVWNCPAIAVLTQKVIDAGMLSQAQAVWRQSCGSPNSLVYDGGFDLLDTTQATAGFTWHLSNRGDVTVRLLQDSAGNRKLGFEVSAAQSVPVIRQLLVLKPGTYQLSWKMPETSAAAATALQVSISCDRPNLADAMPGKRGEGTTYTQTITIDQRCPARQLIFWLAPNAKIELDNVDLQPQ